MNNQFWKAAIWSGIIAGIIMLILEMVMNPLFLDKSMWGPSRMIGAILLGSEVLPPPATFDFWILMAATAVHLPLSVVFAIIIGFLVRKVPVRMAVIIGAGIGLIIYVSNFYGFTAFFPWFADARNWVQIVIHILFGLAAAWSFKSIYKEEITIEVQK